MDKKLDSLVYVLNAVAQKQQIPAASALAGLRVTGPTTPIPSPSFGFTDDSAGGFLSPGDSIGGV